MKVLRNIPFAIDPEPLMQRLRIECDSDDHRDFLDLLRLTSQSANPKAIYTEAYVEPGEGDKVRIGDVVFTSATLKMNLASVGRVFPYVATCGHEMDQIFDAKDDFLKEFWWDNIKAELLKAACAYLNNHLESTFHLGKSTAMSPGSGDATVWPIEQQSLLFSLLGDVSAQIGVQLTPSFLMIPNKTISGIKFAAEKDFRTCQLCHRENCPTRSAPFNQQLWDSIQHD
ncbi:MAG: hypothetical protein JW936_00715 [Sedimentisphaerales bacterium]|nr:hypothetical protein [Sedimentisphaerales bacterium]